MTRADAEKAAADVRAELDESRRETERVKREAAAVEKELSSTISARDAKIGDLEDEIEDMQSRLIELETLLVEQQKALEILVATTLREVAKREKIWTEQRSTRDSKIELLTDLAESKARFSALVYAMQTPKRGISDIFLVCAGRSC